MTRLLITGNSHVAALREAWDAMTDRPSGLEVDFLGMNHQSFRHVDLAADGKFGLTDEGLVPADRLPVLRMINGALTRDLRHFTHVVVVGCPLGITQILAIVSGCNIDLIAEKPANLPRMSQAAYTAFSQSIALGRLPVERLLRMTSWCKTGLFIAPRPSERALHIIGPDPVLLALKADLTGLHAALSLTEAALGRAISALGLRYFGVPQISLADSGLTLEAYARDASLLTSAGTLDYQHMNADYGALCLEPVLQWALS